MSLVVLFAGFMVAVTAFTVYGLRYSDRVYEGTVLAGVDIGGMTREEVAVVLDSRFDDFAETPVVFSDGSNEYEVPVSELGISLNEEATIDRAMAYGRSGTWWERSQAWSRGLIEGQELSPVLEVNDTAFRGSLEIIAPEVIYAPSDAHVVVSSNGEATLVDDVAGRSLHVGLTRDRVLEQVADLEQAPVPLALVSVPAGVLDSDIERGLPIAQRAVSSAITVTAEEGKWGVSRSVLSTLVAVDETGQLQVNRSGVTSFVEGLASQIDRPAENANVVIDETGAIVVVPHVNSAAVNIEASTDRLITAIEGGETSVDLVVTREEPAILDATAEEWADRAEAYVQDGLELTWSGGSSQLGRADLVAALTIEAHPDKEEQFSLGFDPTVLASTLEPLRVDLDVPVREAKFRLIDGQIKFQEEARQGREVDVDKTVEAITAAIMNGDGSAGLVLNSLEPTYTGADRDSIVLEDVLGQSQTYYGTSSEPRRHNVERATELEDGWLIPPDGVFSYAEIMGLVDEANGFVTGFGIVADPGGGVTTAPVIGGGICQVSTTIFQAAFWAGLPIEERWAHPYWINSYGEEPYGMQGLDAMVNIEPGWALDLKFRNNTGNWIALVMVADGEYVHAEILGVDPGWEIDVADPVITDIEKPEEGMTYTDSPELPKGQELQVEHAREGFTSTITRVVRDSDGKVVDEYSYSSEYAASRDRTLRGTGTEQESGG
jgi:vancomycin resistance protein YoaR